jgi:hypothetical protein
MLIEQRTYTIEPQRMEEYLALYESEGLPIQSKVLRLVGYFQAEAGPLRQVVHFWAYDSTEDYRQKRAQLQETPGWKEYATKAKQFYAGQESRIMAPLPWSPIR